MSVLPVCVVCLLYLFVVPFYILYLFVVPFYNIVLVYISYLSHLCVPCCLCVTCPCFLSLTKGRKYAMGQKWGIIFSGKFKSFTVGKVTLLSPSWLRIAFDPMITCYHPDSIYCSNIHGIFILLIHPIGCFQKMITIYIVHDSVSGAWESAYFKINAIHLSQVVKSDCMGIQGIVRLVLLFS